MAGTLRTGLVVVLLGVATLASTAALAQSVHPNRYGTTPPGAAGDQRNAYERQRQMVRESQTRRDQAVRRGERDRIGLAIEANRRRMEADRARTDRRRAEVPPEQAERLRHAFEARRQGYERQREQLERQRAEMESAPARTPPR